MARDTSAGTCGLGKVASSQRCRAPPPWLLLKPVELRQILLVGFEGFGVIRKSFGSASVLKTTSQERKASDQ